MKEITKEDITHNLSPRGRHRLIVLVGNNYKNWVKQIKCMSKSIVDEYPDSFSVFIDAEKIKSPEDLCSQFARNLKNGRNINDEHVFNFASSVGHSIGSSKRPVHVSHPVDSIGEAAVNLAESLIKSFDNLMLERNNCGEVPHILLSFSGLNKASQTLRRWLVNDLNHALRKSVNFKNCRFLFTIDKKNSSTEDFFDQFGFEKIHYEMIDEDKKIILPKVESDKLLGEDMQMSSKMDLLDSFSPSDLKYLILCSYPKRVSKYTLEHFSSIRDAALAYNWLSRQKTLHSLHESGDLSLDDSLRIAIRSFHQETKPEEAADWSTKASVLDTFQELFPIDATHWIAINLQLLDSFNSRILNNLFDNERIAAVLYFIKDCANHVVEKGSMFSLTDEAKIVTRRYMELSGQNCLAGIEDQIIELWLKDQDHYKSQKEMMEVEKKNVTSEIEDTLSQVASLNETKESLVEDFHNPKRKKAAKTYSFTSSRALIIIGVGTIAASLLSESIGSYHAACGLALTLFGFFWPNVESKRESLAMEGPRANLAIETQQRSLSHRISSLCNRIQVMKGNLNDVDKKLTKLGGSPPAPYLEAETES
jgi:hypothetical protein